VRAFRQGSRKYTSKQWRRPESEQMVYQLKLKVSEPQADRADKTQVRPERLNEIVNKIVDEARIRAKRDLSAN
jgi:hypothetical protein